MYPFQAMSLSRSLSLQYKRTLKWYKGKSHLRFLWRVYTDRMEAGIDFETNEIGYSTQWLWSQFWHRSLCSVYSSTPCEPILCYRSRYLSRSVYTHHYAD